MTDGEAPTPREIYCLLVGPIDQSLSQRVAHNITVATANRVPHIHLLLQSAGGFIGDGVFLYNLFRRIPLDLTLYNAGQISSAAVIAYLGGQRRKTSARATFMIHRSMFSAQFAGSAKLQSVAKGLTLDDERTEAILRTHMTLPDELWKEVQYHDVYISGEEAVRFGLADEIAEFAPPKGVQVFSLLG